MKRDPHAEGANPFADRERHTVSITRMCLRSGSVQLPFALMDRLAEGEVLAVDTEKSEAMVLWSTPPRTLQGLAPLFAAHEVQVNDQLVLEPRDEELRVTVQKRPRRSRPKVQASTWSSVRDEGSKRPKQAPSEPEERAETPASASDGSAGAIGRWPVDASGGWSDRAPGEADASPTAHESAQQVRMHPLDGVQEGAQEEVPPVERAGRGGGRGERPRAARRGGDEEGGWLGGMVRRARGMFGGGSGRHDADEPDPAPQPKRDAWARAWNDPREEDPLAPPWREEATRAQDAPRPRGPREARDARQSGARDARGLEPGAPARARELDSPDEPRLRFGPDPDFDRDALQGRTPGGDDPFSQEDVPAPPPDAAAPRRADARPADAQPERDAATGPSGPGGGAGAAEPPNDRPRAPGPDEEHSDAPPADAPAADPSESAPAAPDTEGAPPSRAEKFLGGDLRTRLLRHLTAPDAPVIAGFESIAERFDLEPDMALELLDDIAADPPPGLRLTRIREGTYRLERQRS